MMKNCTNGKTATTQLGEVLRDYQWNSPASTFKHAEYVPAEVIISYESIVNSVRKLNESG